MGAIVEEFVEGAMKRSPSVQYRIDPLGQIEVISTHDQVLGGRSNQVFLGCRFPADVSYRLDIQEEGLKAARICGIEGFWDGLASTSSRCGMAVAGGIVQSRSICARVGPPTHS